MTRIVVVLLLSVFLFAPSAVAEESADPKGLVTKLLTTEDPAARESLTRAILAVKPSVTDLVGWLGEGRDYPKDVPTGWREMTIKCADEVERPYLIHVPDDYDPSQSYPLLLELHGGVALEKPMSHAALKQMASMPLFWGPHSIATGVIYVLPAGSKRATWWSEVGSGMVLSILDATMREYNVDESRVRATGFSDGGSGCFYLALTHPTRFAAFLPFNAHVAVAGVGGHQVYLRNLVNAPMYVVNTGRDSLYPSASAKPYMDQAKVYGADLTWVDVPEKSHDPRYLPEVRPAAATWMDERTRDAAPKRVVWEGTATSPSRVHWLRSVTLGETGKSTEFRDFNPKLGPARLRLGISVERGFAGPGVKVTGVSEGTTAEAMKLRSGDVIVSMDGKEISGLQDLQTALSAKKPGDDVKVVAKRGEETVTLEGRFPEPKPRHAFLRTHPSGAIEIVREGNVFTVKSVSVSAFELLLNDSLVDFGRPVVVVRDGRTLFEGTVKPDLAFTLDQALADRDRTTIYTAVLRVAVIPEDD